MSVPGTFGPDCPTPVTSAVMVHHWDELTFIHWRFAAADVQRLLPAGLEVETFDGDAWVGLVPFYMRVGLPGVPSVPWLSRFCETNVRTYVRSADGESGIWFFSLDASRLGAVCTARATYRLPYFWSRMRLDWDGPVVTYDCRRWWPGPAGVTSRAVVKVGEPFPPGELDERDHFLTARWALFSAPRSGLHHARAAHDPWPLHRAELLDLDDGLIEAAGLPKPSGEPLLHFSHSVQVRIGWPGAVGRERPATGRRRRR
jgi:uncharacterized protein YqjF (DUF2071 family)